MPYAESIGALNDLQREGKIRHIGVSNVTLEQLAVARAVTAISTVQNRLDLTNRQVDRLSLLVDNLLNVSRLAADPPSAFTQR